MQPDDAESFDGAWWDEEDDEWSDDAYYKSLSDYFMDKYYQLTRGIGPGDCD